MRNIALVLALGLLSAGACSGGFEPGSPESCERCDQDAIAPEKTETLFEFTATNESTLKAQIASFESIFDAQLDALGYGGETTATRGSTEVISLEFSTTLNVLHNGKPMHWTGFIQAGGSLSKETYANGAEVLILDFGTNIFTTDGNIVGPNLDRFAAHGDKRLTVSNWVENKDGKTYGLDPSSWTIAKGSAEAVAKTIGLAMTIATDNVATTYSGAEAAGLFANFVAPSDPRPVYSESLRSLRRVNGKQGLSFLLQASADADQGPIPVSIFRVDEGEVDIVKAFRPQAAPPIDAEYLSLVYSAESSGYVLDGIVGLDLLYGDYTIDVAVGDNHDAPESIYRLTIENGSPAEDTLTQLCSAYQCGQ